MSTPSFPSLSPFPSSTKLTRTVYPQRRHLLPPPSLILQTWEEEIRRRFLFSLRTSQTGVREGKWEEEADGYDGTREGWEGEEEEEQGGGRGGFGAFLLLPFLSFAPSSILRSSIVNAADVPSLSLDARRNRNGGRKPQRRSGRRWTTMRWKRC